MPSAARRLLSAAATSCSSPRISCRHPTPSSPSPLSFPFRLLIVVLSGGQSCCYRRWCRRCRQGCPLSSVAFVVRPRPLSPLPMADVIRHHQSVTLTAGASTSPLSSPGPPVVVATPPAMEQRAIAVVAAAAAAVGDDAGVRLRVILVLVVPAIPPPSPQSRASTAPIARRFPPPPHDDDARDPTRALRR